MKEEAPGPGVDAKGRSVVDPTENVIALTKAAVTRLDDLRDADSRLTTIEFKRVDAALQHASDMMALRADHEKEINALESNRLNAIRQVDVLAVSTAADRAQAAIQALASVTTTNAENLRNALTTTATTLATQLTNTVAGINERLATLEKSSYTGAGKQAVADPQMAELVLAVNKLMSAGNMNLGKQEGVSLSAAVLMGIVSLVGSLLGIGGILYAILKP